MKHYFGSLLLTTLTLFTLFALDLWFFFLEGKQLTFFVLALFIAALFSPHNRTGIIIGCGLLLLCESLAINGSLWLPLVYALPTALIITALRPRIYPHALYPSLAVGLCIVALLLVHSFFRSHQFMLSAGLIITLFINMLIAGIFFLRLKKSNSPTLKA